MKRKLHLSLNMELSVSSVSVVMLLSVFIHDITPHRSEITVPRIVSSKLQLFNYASLTVTCEGFFNHTTQWRVLRGKNGQTTSCNKNSSQFGPCHIPMVYTSDSGEYWCESRDPQRRSESVYITVTDGGAVLESPVRPVMVGDDVTLRCIEKKKQKLSTEFYFYKDGAEINTSPTGEMTIHNISESDQGLYRCSTSDRESSGENLLRVRAVLLQCPDRPVTEGTNLTLICTDKMAAPNHMALFFKDGETIGSSSSGKLTLKVSKSDEGVYKCRSSEGRESEEQWLAVGEITVPRIVPSKLQLFQYSNLTVTCEGFFNSRIQWRVVRNKNGQTTPCNTYSSLFGPYHIPMVYTSDSGEYWCESLDPQRRSESINITVTAGDVVLESPVRPVMVGNDVTLRCIEKKNKNASSKYYFYKDGAEINTSPTGEMTIHNISESDQGLYRCSTSDRESSGENLLRVRAVLLQCPDRPVTEGTNLTLICTDKMAAPNHMALFFKDGETIGSSSSGKLTLKVSKSDEGVYRCRSSEGRESEEQWLAVGDGSVTSAGDVSDEPQPTASPLFGLVALPLLLLVLWFIYKRHKGQRVSSGSETYAAVMKPKHKNRATAESETTSIHSEISEVQEPRAGNDPVGSREETETNVDSTVNEPESNSRGAEANAELYSTVDKKKKKKKKKDCGATEAAELYSEVKKNKGKKFVEDDGFYSQIR